MVPNIYRTEAGLTGRCRPRLGRFGRIVMQVEIKLDVEQALRRLPSETRWRDAKPSDFMSSSILRLAV